MKHRWAQLETAEPKIGFDRFLTESHSKQDNDQYASRNRTRLLDKLRSIPDGDRNLLDHSIILWQRVE